MKYTYFKLFYGYIKSNGCYPDFDSIGHQTGLFRVALSGVEDEVRAIYDKTAPDSWDELSAFDEDRLPSDMINYLGEWYDLDESFISMYWTMWEHTYQGRTDMDDLNDRVEHDKLIEILPQVIEFIPYHDVKEAISSMRRMTEKGLFDNLGFPTSKADSMRDEMLRNMETVIRFIERYRRA